MSTNAAAANFAAAVSANRNAVAPPRDRRMTDVAADTPSAPRPTAAAAAPAVTVLMAVHNGAEYLRQTVDSILSQTFGDFEFLIYDDGSTDDAPAVLAGYAATDARVRVVTQANRGLTRTLNTGLAEARGPLVARMDADDVARPQRLATQVAYMAGHPECVLLGSAVEFIDPAGRPIGPKPGMLLDHEAIDRDLMRKGWPVVHPAVVMRRAAALAIGGYAEAYVTNQDHDLFLRLAEVGRVANLPDVLLQYRQHFKSVSISKSREQGETVERILRQAYDRRGLTLPPTLATSRPLAKSELDHHRDWAWASLAAGNVATARVHALAVLRARPVDAASWKLLYCAVRGQ